MAAIYASLIIKGAKAIEDVPEILREQVRAILTGMDALAEE